MGGIIKSEKFDEPRYEKEYVWALESKTVAHDEVCDTVQMWEQVKQAMGGSATKMCSYAREGRKNRMIE